MPIERVRIILHGAVQGVGFRPFTYRLATELGLHGWGLNSSQGVFIEVEGSRPSLDQFLLRLERRRRLHANDTPPLRRAWTPRATAPTTANTSSASSARSSR
jgi:hydrogenase maturation factor HypF (carbamoyltransferase family)